MPEQPWNTTSTLHMLCGKIAAGKSTLARQLADVPFTVLLSEDPLRRHPPVPGQ
jgi:predicted kinase